MIKCPVSVLFVVIRLKSVADVSARTVSAYMATNGTHAPCINVRQPDQLRTVFPWTSVRAMAKRIS